MRKLFYLSTCSTCKRLMKTWNLPETIALVDLKQRGVSQDELLEMYRLSGSYESLFSKRSQKFIGENLQASIHSDADYGRLLPQDYTFLKRPVLIYDDHIFIGNDKKNEARVLNFLEQIR